MARFSLCSSCGRLLAVSALVAVMVAGVPASSSSRRTKKAANTVPKTSAEARKLQDAAQKEIQATKERIRLNEKEIKSGLSDLNRLSADIKAGRAKVEGLQGKVADLGNEITTLGNEIARNEAELSLMREEYLKAVRKMRLTKKNRSTLAFIFSSDNFNQAMRRMRYMRQFSAWKEKKSADIDAKILSLAEERKRLSEAKDAQTLALNELSRTQQELETRHKEQQRIVSGLRQNGDLLQKHLAAKQAEANALKATISSLIAQEQAKAEAERKAREKAEAERKAREKEEAERKAREKTETEKLTAEKGASKKEEPASKNVEKKVEKNAGKSAAAKEFASLRGSLPRPVDGAWRITNPFGRHSMPELPEIEYDNPGIDAEVATGAAVKAVCGGKVSGVYRLDGYGTVVIVSHGEYYTVYGNLSSANVSVGTQVGGGESLGVAGADPDNPRQGSVHFEVWKGREKQNPSSWLR